MRSYIFLIAFTFVSVSLQAEIEYARSAEIIELGREVYLKHCTRCHGVTGAGDGLGAKYLNPKPRDFRSDIYKFGMRPEQVFSTISSGSPGTAMLGQAERFSVKERWALSYYVLSLRGKD